MVSAAGVAPAIPRSQAERVGCYTTRSWPRPVHGAGAGETQDSNPGNGPAASSLKEWRTRRELHPQPSRRQRGALLVELRVQKWWEVLAMLPSSLPASFFRTRF